MPGPWAAVPLQTEGLALACWIVGAVVGALLLMLAGLMAYQRYVTSRRPVQHLCDYCGHMVSAVSDCHHAPVREQFLRGICVECRNECRPVCATCKRRL